MAILQLGDRPPVQRVLASGGYFFDWEVADSQMSRRTGSERHEVLLDLIYGAVADPHKWPEILTRLSDHLGAVGGMIAYLPARGRALNVIGRLSEALNVVSQRHHTWNPWAVAMKSVPFNEVVIGNSLIAPGALSRNGFYDDILAPQEIVDSLATSHASMALHGSLGGFG